MRCRSALCSAVAESAAELQRVIDVVAFQAAACTESSSPLYGRVLDVVVDDLRAGGATARLLGGRGEDPFGSALALRFLGAVHRIVLEGRRAGARRPLPLRRRARTARPGGDVPGDGRGARGRDRVADRGRRADQRGGSLGRAGGRVRDGDAPHLPPAAHPRGGGQRRPEPAMGPLRATTPGEWSAGIPTARCASPACGAATHRISRPASMWSSAADAIATPSTPPRPRDASP